MAFDYIVSGAPVIPAPTQPAFLLDKDNNIVYVSSMPSLSNAPAWVMVGGSGTNPAGSNRQIQFNNNGSFGADSALDWNSTSKTLSLGSGTPSSNDKSLSNVVSQNADVGSNVFSLIENILTLTPSVLSETDWFGVNTTITLAGTGGYDSTVSGSSTVLDFTGTGDASSLIGHNFIVRNNSAGGGTVDQLVGIQISALSQHDNAGLTGSCVGIFSFASSHGGNITTLYSGKFGVDIGFGNVTDAAAVHISSPAFEGGTTGVATALYGIFIEDQTPGGAQNLNPWAVYSAGGKSFYRDGFVLDTDSGPIWKSGSGSPEGAVSAPVGSLWTRTDGGTSTTLYVKESGSGNTGWVAK